MRLVVFVVFILFPVIVQAQQVDTAFCKFDGIKASLEQKVNPKKYWIKQVSRLEKEIKQIKEETRRLQRELSEYGRTYDCRLEVAASNARMLGSNAAEVAEARREEAEFIRGERDSLRRTIRDEKSLLEEFKKCLEYARGELSTFQ